jgi:hypothetical protein
VAVFTPGKRSRKTVQQMKGHLLLATRGTMSRTVKIQHRMEEPWTVDTKRTMSLAGMAHDEQLFFNF